MSPITAGLTPRDARAQQTVVRLLRQQLSLRTPSPMAINPKMGRTALSTVENSFMTEEFEQHFRFDALQLTQRADQRLIRGGIAGVHKS